jgi:tRNA(fMet)-specific endonuclease VapC
MIYLLDTNICIKVIRKQSAFATARLQNRLRDVAISSITYSELAFGAAKSTDPQLNLLLLNNFCSPLSILPYDDAAGATYGPVRAYLESVGSPIGPLDTLIAAHALALGLILVTDNQREFRRVPGLTVENWTKP